ncbi:putative F-box domain-containing protein [Helianthus annuus]|nr:putative F-box domain-containing protein [Helianthus annuus]
MKRSITSVSESESEIFITSNTKKIKQSALSPSRATEVLNDENLLYEIFKHVDERTLGSLSCVSKRWNRTAQDERLWEMICTKHWTNMACGDNKLRSVVLALGGFRKLHAHYLYPLSKSSGSTTGLPSSSSSAVASAVSGSVWPCLPPRRPTVGCEKSNCLKTHYGQDEVQLSLSLLSIRYFETIRFRNRND